MKFDDWWASLTQAEQKMIGINNAAFVWNSAVEACAKVCEDSVPTYLKDGERWLKGKNGEPDVRLKEIAPNLEAAWEAEQLLKNGSVLESYSVQHQCAAAIRARGQDPMPLFDDWPGGWKK